MTDNSLSNSMSYPDERAVPSRTDTQAFYVVGIGASAGGLDACRKLFRSATTYRCCFILCQHLAPQHDSKLAEIITGDTDLDVRQIQDGDLLHAGCIFVVPPNTDVVVTHGRFLLRAPESGAQPKPNINRFFISLAENFGSRSIAVVLSGTGNDGSSGISSIRGAGGVVLAQDPGLSDYDGMPSASISTHMVDVIGSPEVLGKQISRIVESDLPKELSAARESSEADTYNQILRLISDATTIDFTQYKRSTIRRRLERRMAIRGLASLDDYLSFLRTNVGEIWAFTQDAFINVSQFYRDPAQFDFFKHELVARLRNLEPRSEFRIWVAGCAFGEEAYSVAMLLEDLKLEHNLVFDYKILATDISEKAISRARLGIFQPDVLRDAPATWMTNYFEKCADEYEVRKAVRDRIIFSVHNVFADPPFSKLDVICCRNLLIYFDAYLQEQLLRLFHYVLNPDVGLLFLGNAESVSSNENFLPVGGASIKVYRRTGGVQMSPPNVRRKNRFSGAIELEEKQKPRDIENQILQKVCTAFVPPTVVLDKRNSILFTYGKYSVLLSEKTGLFDVNFFDLILPDLKTECRALVFRARQKQEACYGVHKNISLTDGAKYGHLVVRLLAGDEGLICVSLVMEDTYLSPGEAKSDSVDDRHFAQIEMELSSTRENLQTVIEELEVANEQLQIYNEELQSSNEEFQCTNEELQTVNEELQSTNEELITVNEEYALKTAEQTRLSSDLENIQNALEIPFLLISKEYRILRFTENCSHIFDTQHIQIGDLFFAVDWRGNAGQIKALILAAECEAKSQIAELEIDDRSYQCQVSPYINASHVFDGYIVIFYDMTNLTRSKEALAFEKFQAQKTLELVAEGVIRLNTRGTVEYINPAALKILCKSHDEIAFQRLASEISLYDEVGGSFSLEQFVQRCLQSNESFVVENNPLLIHTGSETANYIELSIVPLQLSDDVRGCIITLRDTSERHRQLERLKWQSTHDSLTGLVNREEMEKRLERAIATSRREGIESSLLYMDLDQFKVINDTCGHLAGDQLLKQLAQLIRDMLRTRDTFARLGGDEFAILLDHCPILEAEAIAHKIKQKVCDYRFAWEDKAFRVGVSIGIVGIHPSVSQLSQVLSDADAACYAAKEAGRNCIQIHTQDNKVLEAQRLQMRSISDINQAIESDHFRLYFQQIHAVGSGAIQSWEILIRMFNATGEFLLPSHFLPAAERFGLINRIDTWVVESALRNVAQYFGQGKERDFPLLSLNVSGATISDPAYLDLVSELFTRYQYPANKISFEITETSVVRNLVKASEFMRRARELGCKLALDDFGTGLSSLSYLGELPVDRVKIDMSFVKNIVDNPVNRAIVNSVKEVAHLLKLEVVAEGVETPAQLACLRELGVDAYQGFLAGKPLPFEEFVCRSLDTINLEIK